MRVYFLRHGIAQDGSPSMADADRQLVPAGIEKIKQLATKLEPWDVQPAVIYSSPLVRAHQTAQIVAEYTGIHLQIQEALGLDFSARALQSIVDKHAENEDIMVVGHEPSFSSTISYIIGGGNITMKKGGLARVDLYSQHPLHGTLVWLLPPRLLD